MSDSYDVQEIEQVLKQSSQEVLKLMSDTSVNNFDRIIKNYGGEEVTMGKQITTLLLHDTEHLGEIKWVFKRLTNFTDKEMYRIN